MNRFDSIFGNANVKVKEHKYLKSSQTKETTVLEAYSNMQSDMDDDARIASVENKIELGKKDEVRTQISAMAAFESFTNNLCTSLYAEGKEVLFKNIMSDIYMESLYLDKDFKDIHSESIKSTMGEYIDKNKGYCMLESACKNNNTKLLRDMKEIVDKSARDSSIRKITDIKKVYGVNGVMAMEAMTMNHEFDMNESEMTAFNKSREKLSEEQISKVVKDKILNVIKEERDKHESLERFEEEINDRANSISDKKNLQDTIKESISRNYMENRYTDLTLFEAIQVDTMREMISVTESNFSGISDSDSDSDSGRTIEEILGIDDDSILGDGDIVTENKIDMDLVLAESISKYSLLEVCSSMKLEKFDRNRVQEMCYKLSK